MKTGIEHKISRTALVAAAIAMGSFSPSVFAYLDPSTGSMILSAIVGIFATLGLAIKTYWYKLKSLFRGSESAPVTTAAERQSETTTETGTTGN